MNSAFWSLKNGAGPIIAVANHHGHLLRPEVANMMSLDEASQLREEDPFTGDWADLVPTCLVAQHSRFEVDLNRPRESAVYLTPEDAWGLSVWRSVLPRDQVERSLAAYDSFYSHVRHLLEDLVLTHGRVVVFDLHSYNHRRQGPDGPLADPEENPEVNIGTGKMDRQRLAPIVDRCINELRAFDYHGRHLDVRENVKFRGGNFPRWIHETFPDTVCSIAIEFKKFFMDEWTGQPDHDHLYTIGQTLQRAADAVTEELESIGQIEAQQ